jgi:MFS family permease
MSTAVPRESQREQQDEALDYPEGGPRAWGVVFGSCCVSFSVFGIINTSAVFESYFTEHQLKGESSSRLAWIFSVYLFLIYFIGLLVGPVFDHHGHRILILTASILAVVSPFILSFCSGNEFVHSIKRLIKTDLAERVLPDISHLCSP